MTTRRRDTRLSQIFKELEVLKTGNAILNRDVKRVKNSKKELNKKVNKVENGIKKIEMNVERVERARGVKNER